jgi:hypothetical protein
VRRQRRGRRLAAEAAGDLQVRDERREVLLGGGAHADVGAVADLVVGLGDVLLVVGRLEVDVERVEGGAGLAGDDAQLPLLAGRRRLRDLDVVGLGQRHGLLQRLGVVGHQAAAVVLDRLGGAARLGDLAALDLEAVARHGVLQPQLVGGRELAVRRLGRRGGGAERDGDGRGAGGGKEEAGDSRHASCFPLPPPVTNRRVLGRSGAVQERAAAYAADGAKP